MSSDKKKGDFDKSRKHDVGGDKKQDNTGKTASRKTQNAGTGGRR